MSPLPRAGAVLGLLLAMLVACSTAPAVPSFATRTPAPVAVAPPARPTEISIPAISARSSLIATGLNSDGTVAVPDEDDPLQASWFDRSPPPGQIGPAVILGHVDGNIGGRAGQPGIFHRLRELQPGDQAMVDLDNGTTAVFVVDAVDVVKKDAFPTRRVYGDVPNPQLRLITCGGPFDHTARSYVDNIVVFATLQNITGTTPTSTSAAALAG